VDCEKDVESSFRSSLSAFYSLRVLAVLLRRMLRNHADAEMLCECNHDQLSEPFVSRATNRYPRIKGYTIVIRFADVL
jgi:hypothetical protein